MPQRTAIPLMKRAGRNFFKKIVEGTSQAWYSQSRSEKLIEVGELIEPYDVGGEKDSNGGLELIPSEAKVFFQPEKSTVTDICPRIGACWLENGSVSQLIE